MSVTEVLVAAGLSTLLLIGVSKLYVGMTSANQKIDIKSQSANFYSALGTHFMESSSCKSSLKNLTLSKAAGVAGPNFTLNNFKGYGSRLDTLNNPIPVAAGVDITPGRLRVKAFNIKEKDGISQTISSMIGGVSLLYRVAEISLQLESFETSGGNGPATWKAQKTEVFEVPVYLDGTGKIQDCSVEGNLENACKSMGLAIIPEHCEATCATPGTCAVGPAPPPCSGAFPNYVPSKCKPATTCITEGTYSKVSCSPSNYGCNYSVAIPGSDTYTPPLVPNLDTPPPPPSPTLYGNPVMGGKQACPTGTTATFMGSDVYMDALDCGKKCTIRVYTTTQNFTCLRCN